MAASPEAKRVGLSTGGIVVGDETVPLLSGSVHYFRMPRSSWKPALEALRGLGARFVDTYVPWSVHERERGVYDFGEHDPRLDVGAFLEVASSVGLYAIVRPGPHINAELTEFGIPGRVLWDERCMARSPSGAPVVLPMPPGAFPIPSYASSVFHEEAELWLRRAAEEIAPYVYPDGPVLLVQVDNEGSLYFRDGPYDQDYHPDSVEQYRRFLVRRYQTPTALRAAHGDPELTFASVAPPARLDEQSPDRLARHLDWAEYQEALIETAFYRFRRTLDRHGLRGVPTMHNLPVAESATPLDPARLERSVDFLSIDYYHHASERIRGEIARRTSHVATRGRARGVPSFAAEMGAGFAPYFPPLSEGDNAFTAMSALAYGLRGMNLYMAVTRDRWIGGPIDLRGRPRESARLWTSLFAALERTRFHTLVRETPVHLVVPRSYERLTRICHAFTPVPQAAFAFAGESVLRAGLEGELDPTGGATAETESFLHLLEGTLGAEGVAHTLVSDDLLSYSTERAAWTIVLCPGALPEEQTRLLTDALLAGKKVSFGPRLPERSASMRPSGARVPRMEGSPVPLLLPRGPATLRELVSSAATDLGLERLTSHPEALRTTLHRDASGTPRVLFVINGGDSSFTGVAGVAGAVAATDALTLEALPIESGHVHVTMPPRTVRMLELAPAS
ncbi:MAG TPA: beta-galactosidase [Polyangiaceae bacterium]|nr:beta-galactosidase [Polyangiaceae bacterium]